MQGVSKCVQVDAEFCGDLAVEVKYRHPGFALRYFGNPLIRCGISVTSFGLRTSFAIISTSHY
jgi:hypothetical protein